ncbi:phosphate ABC transporter permease PstA [Segatella bryantii]|jgi:phosphate transport system permease protein|uniref:phosphate ABC transporter permease PstA n=1 Tax=Segatella bryantii TaxID=77095 RepID=UPI001EDBFAD6|nr:phosphate ABC transporter permease PstA [Segatella bryantii]UKK74770.1 phosphate ABC transporter permease PstA [Segatella bryantii]
MIRSVIEEKIAKLLMYLSAVLILYFVLSVIFSVFSRGLPVLTWEMITSTPGGGFYIGGKGGFLNAIMGSVYIVGGSTIIGLLISIPVVFYLNVYLKPDSKFGSIARLGYDMLFGIPSIVYGAFGFTIMVLLGLRASLLGGIIVVTLLIIPIFIRSMDEVAKSIPKDLLEASFSLGATRWETIGIVVRQIAPAIATATLLSIGRAIGDAAGVMFTAGFSDNIPDSLSRPAATLPLSVFFQLSAPQQEVQDRAYAAAVVLTIIVLILSLAGRFVLNRFSKNKI